MLGPSPQSPGNSFRGTTLRQLGNIIHSMHVMMPDLLENGNPEDIGKFACCLAYAQSFDEPDERQSEMQHSVG